MRRLNWRWLKYQCLLFKAENVELKVAEISMFIEVAEIPMFIISGGEGRTGLAEILMLL